MRHPGSKEEPIVGMPSQECKTALRRFIDELNAISAAFIPNECRSATLGNTDFGGFTGINCASLNTAHHHAD